MQSLSPLFKILLSKCVVAEVEDTKAADQSIGGRNDYCRLWQGSRICQKANTDITGCAQRLEHHIYPQPYHLRLSQLVVLNDCAKAIIW